MSNTDRIISYFALYFKSITYFALYFKSITYLLMFQMQVEQCGNRFLGCVAV